MKALNFTLMISSLNSQVAKELTNYCKFKLAAFTIKICSFGDITEVNLLSLIGIVSDAKEDAFSLSVMNSRRTKHLVVNFASESMFE